jgi:hypothetical protein
MCASIGLPLALAVRGDLVDILVSGINLDAVRASDHEELLAVGAVAFHDPNIYVVRALDAIDRPTLCSDDHADISLGDVELAMETLNGGFGNFGSHLEYVNLVLS